VKVRCACGRQIGSKVFRQHGRKCDAQLQAWADGGASVYLLDERSPERKAARPIRSKLSWTS
jgi:hypothetical protein